MSELTKAQRDTLDAAEQILVGLLTCREECLMFSLHHGWEGISVTYFTPSGAQHSGIWPVVRGERPTLSDKINRVLEIRVEEEGRADRIKAERIARLRKELAELDGAA